MARQAFTEQFGGRTAATPQSDAATRRCQARQLVALTVLVFLLSACASLTSRELFPEVSARQAPAITLGAIVDLLPGPVETSAILVRANGTAAVVAVDRSRQLHYIAIANNGAVARQVIGTIDRDSNPRVDFVEHRGRLRVLAGDKQFFRGVADSAWQETGGNRCAKFLPVDDALFCAMVIKGEEIKSPARKDWTVGWFILFPVVFWSNESAAKLVIAQESPEGWRVRAVVDGDSPLDAGMDFFAATDSAGQLQLLYSASRGGGVFGVFAGTAPGAVGGGYSGFPEELRYAQIQLSELLASPKDAGPGDSADRLAPWLSVASLRVAEAPTVAPGDRVHPLHRRFSTSLSPGAVNGIFWARELPRPSRSSAFSLGFESGWLNAQLREGVWQSPLEIVAAADLPDQSYVWAMDDRFAVMANSGTGGSHALFANCAIGFWQSTCQLAYFTRTSNRWSAPLDLGPSKLNHDGRAIAGDSRGCSFATWVSAEAKFVGRWIGRCSPGIIE
jgi:hypothetical protein